MNSTQFSYVLLIAFISTANSLTTRRFWDEQATKYGYFSETERLQLLDTVREMFYFGYDNYMKYAFPMDELNPINCSGRGPDYNNPSNININDVLGDYSLTLLDALDTLAIMGNSSEFQHAVRLIIENVSFDKPSTVQVFEATIRVLGSLLSGHLIISDALEPFGPMGYHTYNNELLHMAHDLASRLIVAFENTPTGIPHPRVNLQTGVPADGTNETCTAGAGTLLLEFGLLSRLLNDPVYEGVARRAVDRLWSSRSNVTGLFGNVINIQTGKWTGFMSGLGAGLDSFYEYLLKSFIMFGNTEDLMKFKESYRAIQYYLRRGRRECNSGSGIPPLYVNVNMWSGEPINNWMDSLQAAWPAVQVLAGDLEEAICLHSIYFAIWLRFNALPERYNWHLQQPDVLFYPLRPEFVESTYYLYQATKNPFYLHVGKEIIHSLNTYTRVRCGYATVHDVIRKDHEDRMESFFLGETCKYLFLLFDVDNHVNREAIRYVFSTEGHLFPVASLHPHSVDNTYPAWNKSKKPTRRKTIKTVDSLQSKKQQGFVHSTQYTNISCNCDRVPAERRYHLPLQFQYLQQVQQFIGLN